MLIASACAALLSIFTAYAKFLPAAVVASGHNILPVLIVAAFASRSVWTSVFSPSWKPAFMRACCVAGGQILHVLALFEGHLAKVVLLHHISPLLIPLIAWIWFGERMRLMTAIGLLIGFAGILVVIHPWRGAVIAFDFATVAALLSGVAAALSKMLLYDIARNYDQSARATFIQTFGMATFLSLPFAVYALFAGGEPPLHHATPLPLAMSGPVIGDRLTLAALAAFIAMAVVAVIDQLLTDRAYRLLPNAGIIGPFMYTSVAFSVLFDWWFFGRVPSADLLLGSALVIAGATLAVASVERSAREGNSRFSRPPD
ncbi:DMT family transporter [Ancylobacter oerskovii]|uniref:DMT family transporter n=1 Tax=Ancylobacter oerskovii TaxID=459519 RepID=A0ABW4Z276_9HYPH|nr:DMT family transporter [Ancylobacter oerskovii]MBS7544721.1 DMT family transporter [Ancylobacter oerskovii]